MMHSYGLLDSTLVVISAILQTAAYSIALMIVGCVVAGIGNSKNIIVACPVLKAKRPRRYIRL